jgi:hypothetical protein
MKKAMTRKYGIIMDTRMIATIICDVVPVSILSESANAIPAFLFNTFLNTALPTYASRADGVIEDLNVGIAVDRASHVDTLLLATGE